MAEGFGIPSGSSSCGGPSPLPGVVTAVPRVLLVSLGDADVRPGLQLSSGSRHGSRALVLSGKTEGNWQPE